SDMTPQWIVVQLMRKAFDLSLASNDALSGLFVKTFDVMTPVLKDFEDRIIRRALETLYEKGSICERYENVKVPSVRSLMYGVIESLHFTIRHLTENGESSEIFQPIIEGFKRDAFNISMQSHDSLVSLFLNAFDVMSLILK
ncbi:hypothetical protein PMAYCL1PPCAC_01199, partial [Pristionchus mayeri]